MTIIVDENNSNLVEVAFNQANAPLGFNYEFIITSQYSHQPLVLLPECIESNARYSLFEVQFPAGFGEEHKNGIYYFDLVFDLVDVLQSGLVKIITDPGGGIDTIAFDAGPVTENRVSDVYFRPNY